MVLSKRGGRRNRRWVMLQAPGLNVATLGVILMVAIQLTVWVLSSHRGEEFYFQVYYLWFGLSWDGVMAGRVWQLLSHSWLHGSPLHLTVNALLFYYAAARLSHFLSGARIAGLFLLSAILSGLAHILAQSLWPGLPPLVGASGGLTGLLLGFFAVSPESRLVLFKVSAGNLSKGILTASAILFFISPAVNLPVISNLGWILQSIFGPLLFQAAHLVHFVGGVTGWFSIHRFLPRLLNHRDLVRMRLENESRLRATEMTDMV